MKNYQNLSSFALRLLAMVFMLCDHLWATVIPGNDWLTCIGRLAFPIFAFLTAEGYRHTHDFRKYLRRMILWAAVSELPYNSMYVGSWVYPFQQNVLWTFTLALLCMRGLDGIREKHRGWKRALLSALLVSGCYLAGTILFVDYGGHGVLMALVFYFLRGDRWQIRAGQLGALVYINWFMMKGLVFPVELLGLSLEIPRQGLAIFALPLIWLYRGRQGVHGKNVQLACYAFYPVHMLILGLLARFV